MDEAALNNLVVDYAHAWSSQNPERVAAFFSLDGTLTINDDTPAVGRDQITKLAESYMTAFPDMVVRMDKVVMTQNGAEFHWTWTGRNTGPGGTCNGVEISGIEFLQMNDEGLFSHVKGVYDIEDYDRQMQKS